jgi:hypothetical protein
MTARTWPRIPLSRDERIALGTVRLLVALGVIRPAGRAA